MTVLIPGLLLCLGVHSVRIVAGGWRGFLAVFPGQLHHGGAERLGPPR